MVENINKNLLSSKQTNNFVTIFLLGKIITRSSFCSISYITSLNARRSIKETFKLLGLLTTRYILNKVIKQYHSVYNFSFTTYIYSNSSLNLSHINSLKNNFKLFLYYLYINKVRYYKNVLDRLNIISNIYVDNINSYYPYRYYSNQLNKFSNYYTSYNNYIFSSSTNEKKNYTLVYSKKTKRFPKKRKDKELFKLFKCRVALFNKPKVSIKGKFYYRFRDPKKYLHPFWQKEEFFKKKFKYFSLGASCLVHAFYKHKGLKKIKKLYIFKKLGLLHFWFQKVIKKYKFRSYLLQNIILNSSRLKYKFLNYYNFYKNYNYGSVKLNSFRVKLFENLTLDNTKLLRLYKLFDSFSYFKHKRVLNKILKTSYINNRLKFNRLINLVYGNKNLFFNSFKFKKSSFKQPLTLNKFNSRFIKTKRIKNLFGTSSLYFFSLKSDFSNNLKFLLNDRSFRKHYRYRFIKIFKLSNSSYRVHYFKTKKQYLMDNKKNYRNSFLQRNFRKKHLYWKLIDYKYLFKKGFRKLKFNAVNYRLNFRFKNFKILLGLFTHRSLLKRFKNFKYDRYYIFKKRANKKRLGLISYPLINRSSNEFVENKVLKWFYIDFNKFTFKKSSSYSVWLNHLKTEFRPIFYNNIIKYDSNSNKPQWLINSFFKNKRLKSRKRSFKIVKKIVKYSLIKINQRKQSLLSSKFHKINKQKIIRGLYKFFLRTFKVLFFKTNLRLFSKYTNHKKINVNKYLFKSLRRRRSVITKNYNLKSNIRLFYINSLMKKTFSYYNYFKVFKKNRYYGTFIRFKRRMNSAIHKKLRNNNIKRLKLIVNKRLKLKNRILNDLKLTNLNNLKKLLVHLLDMNKKMFLSLKHTRFNLQKSYRRLTPQFLKVFKNSKNLTFKQKILKISNFSNFLKFWGYKKLLVNNQKINSFDKGFELLRYINYNNSIVLWIKLYNTNIEDKINNNLNLRRKFNLRLLDLKSTKSKVFRGITFLNTLKLQRFEFKHTYLNAISWGLNNLVRKHYNFFLLLCKYFWLFKPVCTFKSFKGLGKLWNYCNINNNGVFNLIGFLNYNFSFSKNLGLVGYSPFNNYKNGCIVRYNNLKISELDWFKKKKDDEDEIFFSEAEKIKAAEKERQRRLDHYSAVKLLSFEFLTPITDFKTQKNILTFETNKGTNIDNFQNYDIVNRQNMLWNMNFTHLFSKNFVIRYNSLFNHKVLPIFNDMTLVYDYLKISVSTNYKFIIEKYIQQIIKVLSFEFLNTENIILQLYKWNTSIIKHNKRIKIRCKVNNNHNKIELGKKLLHNENIILNKLYFGLIKSYKYIFTS